MGKTYYNEEIYKQKLQEIYNGELTLVSRFINSSKHILVQDKYGILKGHPLSILKFRPTIKTALNKTGYFMNLLKEIYPEFVEKLEPMSEYVTTKEKMLFKVKFGLVSFAPDALLHGHFPGIKSAVNRKEYFKNQLLDIYGNKYDFKITSTDRHSGTVTLICPLHEEQVVDSDSIFNGSGCPKCNKDWNKSNLLYIVRLYNSEESFYKLGISHKLKNGKVSRFNSYRLLGYNIEVLKLIEFEDFLQCRNKELELKLLIKNNLYTPKNWEHYSSTETFLDNLLEIVLESAEMVKYDIV